MRGVAAAWRRCDAAVVTAAAAGRVAAALGPAGHGAAEQPRRRSSRTSIEPGGDVRSHRASTASSTGARASRWPGARRRRRARSRQRRLAAYAGLLDQRCPRGRTAQLHGHEQPQTAYANALSADRRADWLEVRRRVADFEIVRATLRADRHHPRVRRDVILHVAALRIFRHGHRCSSCRSATVAEVHDAGTVVRRLAARRIFLRRAGA